MAAVLQCLSCVYGSAGYNHEEAVQMFDIVDADHGTLMTAFCCLGIAQSGRSHLVWKVLKGCGSKAICLPY